MLHLLVVFHSLVRWLVIISLLLSIRTAYRGYKRKKTFTKADDQIRHWTATIAHIQLAIGFTMYLKSPVVKFLFSDFKNAIHHTETVFFSLIHFLLMFSAIVLITIGSSLAKRQITDHEKFKTMYTWFLVSLVIILIAIPWPFSPMAQRPYVRTF